MITTDTFSSFRRVAIGAAIAFGALSAQAGTLTMHSWLFGAGHNVAAGAPNYAGAAGGFKGTLTGMTDARFNLSPIEMYCVDLGEVININNGVSYSVKMAGDGLGATDFTIVSVGSVFGATKASRLGELISYVESNATFVDSSTESTSLQLAIWNTIYDTDGTLDTHLGATFSDASAYRAYANTLLANSAGFGITKDLYVMRSIGNPGKQDQLIWIDADNRRLIPEPTGLALVGVALAGLALSRRGALRRAA
jgi:hypothetical protein